MENKALSLSSSFKPFEGGQNLRPGCFLARQVIFPFVALVRSRYDFRLGSRINREKQNEKATSFPRFPRADESKSRLGMLPPIMGEEVIIRLSPRKVYHGLIYPSILTISLEMSLRGAESFWHGRRLVV